MAKKSIISVKDVNIRTMTANGYDYICITDIARQKNETDPNGVIGNWMRNRNTIEYLGLWEMLNNPGFNPIEFEGVRSQAGLNAFTLSPSRWIELTNFRKYCGDKPFYSPQICVNKTNYLPHNENKFAGHSIA